MATKSKTDGPKAVTLECTLTKSTKGTHVYGVDHNDQHLSFYIPRAMSGGDKPFKVALITFQGKE